MFKKHLFSLIKKKKTKPNKNKTNHLRTLGFTTYYTGCMCTSQESKSILAFSWLKEKSVAK